MNEEYDNNVEFLKKKVEDLELEVKELRADQIINYLFNNFVIEETLNVLEFLDDQVYPLKIVTEGKLKERFNDILASSRNGKRLIKLASRLLEDISSYEQLSLNDLITEVSNKHHKVKVIKQEPFEDNINGPKALLFTGLNTIFESIESRLKKEDKARVMISTSDSSAENYQLIRLIHDAPKLKNKAYLTERSLFNYRPEKLKIARKMPLKMRFKYFNIGLNCLEGYLSIGEDDGNECFEIYIPKR